MSRSAACHSPDALQQFDVDWIDADRWSALGDCPADVIDLADPAAGTRATALRDRTGAVIIGCDDRGQCPVVSPALFDILLTTARDAPQPWVSCDDIRSVANRLAGLIGANPVATTTLARLMRVGAELPFDDALMLESIAYSMLLGGAEFRRWRAATPVRGDRTATGAFVKIAREGDRLTLMLDRVEARNAVCAAMRNQLHEALAAALDDPSRPEVMITGNGPSFSAGGDLDEFGTAQDIAEAHAIRMLRYPVRLIHRLGPKASVRLQGACIGAGIEMSAAAAIRIAAPDAFFQLPETRMGLIPGAGGTVSIPRRIGRHRACFMAIGCDRISASRGLEWGLVTGLGGSA